MPRNRYICAHPLAVALGQVVVHGHDVDAPSGQVVEVDGQRGHEGLALAGLHLGDLALVQDDAAHELHVEMALAQDPARDLAHDRERLRQELVQSFARIMPPLELDRLRREFGVGQLLHVRFQGVDPGDRLLELFSFPALPKTESFLDSLQQSRTTLRLASLGSTRAIARSTLLSYLTPRSRFISESASLSDSGSRPSLR